MKTKVLLIEDNLIDSKLLKAKLKSLEKNIDALYEVDSTDTFQSGMKALGDNSYDIVLLDLNLPDSEGINTVINARRHTKLPIIVFTAQEGDSIGIESIKNGAQDYIYKGNQDAIFIHKTIIFSLERYKLQKNLENQKLQIEKIINSIPDAVLVIDKYYKIHTYNESFLKISECKKNETIDYHLPNYIVDQDKWQAFQKNIYKDVAQFEDNIYTDYFIFKNKHGQEINILLTCQKWENITETETENHFYLITIQDFTDQLKYQQALKDKEMAERTSVMKQQFMANMSHEMRTPLNIINGNIYLMQSTELTSQQLDFLKNQKFATDSLLAIINNILEYSQIETGRLELEEEDFDLNHQCKKIFKSFFALAEDKSIKMSFEYDKTLPVFFKADYFKISQIITNLLANAVKYTDHGYIHFKIINKGCSADHCNIDILVEDSGVGIPNEKFNKIFESFTQLPTENKKKYSGTGLGLSIIKELVSFLDGSIKLKSTPNVGSTFIVSLSLKNTTQKVPHASQKEYSKKFIHNKSFNVLIVEDHVPNQILTKTFLQNWYKNANIEIADNGKIALEKLKESDFDIVLMDLQMPEMDGFEATLSIRNSTYDFKNIPIIAVTAHALKSETDRCTEVGMNDYITKPIDPEILRSIINKYMNIEEESISIISCIESYTNNNEIRDSDNPIKLDYLQKLSMNNSEMILQMLNTLKESTPKELNELKSNVVEESWEKVGKLAHKIKATATYFGQMDLIEPFNLLISNARTETDTDKIPDQVEEVVRRLMHCLEYVDYEIEKINKSN